MAQASSEGSDAKAAMPAHHAPDLRHGSESKQDVSGG